LARLLQTNAAAIVQQLQQLHALGVVEYLPRKESPQIQFLLNRASATHLHIDLDRYHARKKAFTERLEKMIGYVSEGIQCRNQYIAGYFGEESHTKCGICDNCLKQQKQSGSKSIKEKIDHYLQTAARPGIKDLLNNLVQEDSSSVWQYLDTLVNERRVKIDEQGNIQKLP
jgi:ATP-dependent DNA helicase RecQ